jgi:succinyl-CoA synthetase beta subunit|tara:strand:- start:368 stop:1561 length:1194 start_codon:yes stop_codon:yes gene_type:complete
MNLHEYQGKKILAEHGVNIQRGYVLSDKKNTLKIADQLVKETGTGWFVVKAQIHAGGRGKGGGVKLAKNLNELENVVSDILGMYLVTPQTSKEGKLVNQVLITEDVYYPGDSEPEEFYVSILLNRKTGKNMIMYSSEGGMDIESVAEKTPELIFYEDIDPLIGIVPFQARKISFNLGLSGKAFKEMVKFITLLYKSYVSSDSSLFEINPVLKTSDDKIMAVDAKVTLDDNSLFRHKEYESWRDLKEENPIEIEARNIGLNYVDLDGNVGCMVNGAGLAMATMDLIKQSGGEPANFLDVGGTADAKRVEAAFRLIMKDEKVEAILVNIFGGIVRCDRVAQGIVDACNNMGDSINIPIIVRLQGTNAEIAKTIIDNCDFKVYSAVEFQEAADKIQELLK